MRPLWGRENGYHFVFKNFFWFEVITLNDFKSKNKIAITSLALQ